MLGMSYVMTFYVDACALVYFQFHPRLVGSSVGQSVDPGTEVLRQKLLASSIAIQIFLAKLTLSVLVNTVKPLYSGHHPGIQFWPL